jgi:hypothetical protein
MYDIFRYRVCVGGGVCMCVVQHAAYADSFEIDRDIDMSLR